MGMDTTFPYLSASYIPVAPGDLFYVAFAVWEGGSGERGGRKAISDLILAGLEV